MTNSSKDLASLIDSERFAARVNERLEDLETEGADLSLLAALKRSLGRD